MRSPHEQTCGQGTSSKPSEVVSEPLEQGDDGGNLCSLGGIAQVTGFIQEMNAAGTDFELIIYGGAMHGFTHDVGPQAPRVEYHLSSDRRSFQAIKAFAWLIG
jgi:hypothetical protein